MNELIKKYYIEVNFYRSVDFAIVYGTVTAKNFNVKKRDSIVGYTYDTRISLTSSFLFDDKDFIKASEKYLEIANNIQKHLMNECEVLEKNKNLVKELARMVRSEI